MARFQLSTYCNRSASRGEPGDVLDLSEDEIVELELRGSGRRLDSETADAETADDVRPALAEQADKSPRRGRRSKPYIDTAANVEPESPEHAES